MKRKDLVELLERNGWWLKRHGGDHDIYVNGKDREVVPRHKEIAENLAKAIIRRRGLKQTPSKGENIIMIWCPTWTPEKGVTMKEAYPSIMTKDADFVVVEIPDFGINTQGKGFAEAMEMARDAIGLMGIDMEDDGEALPSPSELSAVEAGSSGTITLVDVDFAEYRRRNDMKTVRRNVSLPRWLDAAAERAGINVSSVLQQALKQELNLTSR